jgi:type I restriction enzyme S subunit
MNTPTLRFKEFSGAWEVKKLGDIATFSKGKGISKADIDENGKTFCIRYGELYTEYGETISKVKSKTNVHVDNLVLSEINDVIIPASGETQIDIATASCVQVSGVALGSDLNIIKSKENGIFLTYYLNNQKKLEIAKLAQGNSVVHLYSSQLKLLALNLPDKKEQTKIANFLTAIDEKIAQLSQTAQLLTDYKKGVMQQIFSQQLRFKDDDGREFAEWEEKELKDFLVKHEEKTVESNQYPVLTSSRRGMFFQKDYFDGHDVASKDNTGYNVVPFGFFTFRHMSDDVTFTFNRNHLVDKGIVSTLYPVFTTKNINDNFLQIKLNYGEEFREYAIQQKQGGSRTYMYFSKLEKLKLWFPSLPEQTKIANFLTAIDDKINHNQTQLDAMKQYKSGLLQQMFV